VEEKKKNKQYRKSQFKYDPEPDTYTCPEGKELSFSHIQKRKEKPDVRVYKCPDCPGCPQKEKCTKAEHRTISRDPRDHYTEEMRTRLKTEKGKEMKKQRSTTVEPTFGNMKHNKKFTHFLLRGIEKAGIEFSPSQIGISINNVCLEDSTCRSKSNSCSIRGPGRKGTCARGIRQFHLVTPIRIHHKDLMSTVSISV
jgi:hypothetical protein